MLATCNALAPETVGKERGIIGPRGHGYQLPVPKPDLLEHLSCQFPALLWGNTGMSPKGRQIPQQLGSAVQVRETV